MASAEATKLPAVNGKRVREDSPSTSDVDRNVKPTCDLNLDILECPICIEPLSPPVYQCQNGYLLCSACHAKIPRCPSCSEPTGNTRCLLAEKLIESLQLSCKYASHGCKQMLKYSTREEHIKNWCNYRPCPCPVPECMHEGPKQTLAQHLEEKHDVKTLPLKLNTNSGLYEATLSSTRRPEKPWVRFALLKGVDQKVRLLLRREVIDTLGHLFYFTTFEDYAMKYDPKVWLTNCEESYSLIANASAEEIRQRENWKRDSLLFPQGDSEIGMILRLTLLNDVQT